MLKVNAGVSVRHEFSTGNFVEASLRPYPETPQVPFIELVLTRKRHGQDETVSVQIQTDEYGNVTIRTHEQPGLAALVVNGSGQQYPAP